MKISFKVLDPKEVPKPTLKGVVQLSPGSWDDYSFKTSFHASMYTNSGKFVDLGSVKIGYEGQRHGWTVDNIPKNFEELDESWFSLGQDVVYYKTIEEELSSDEQTQLLRGLCDVVENDDLLITAQQERVFVDSITRGIGSSTIKGQFRRVLRGDAELTDFEFSYVQMADEKHAPVTLTFHVDAHSKPSTNIHVLIGRNGVGKTTLLNNMVTTLLGQRSLTKPVCAFLRPSINGQGRPLPRDYFSSVISVSFSAFDPFVPPKDRQDRTDGPAYIYIGMKNARAGHDIAKSLPPKTDADLVNDFIKGFQSILSQPAKRQRWLTAIKRLESDINFADMGLARLLDKENKEAVKNAGSLAGRMSSGHSVVLLTITKLVDTVEEKTLVLLDEPESHLHPPLLSAFTRALSDLLASRNGVAIIATHSPVVLQEVPGVCVWKLTRVRTCGRADRPERETFGENVGILTREVFGLEIAKSGFHEMLQQAVDDGGSFDSILAEYRGQLGAEAKAILASLLLARDS